MAVLTYRGPETLFEHSEKMLPIGHRGCYEHEPNITALHAAENLPSRVKHGDKSLSLASAMPSHQNQLADQCYWLKSILSNT